MKITKLIFIVLYKIRKETINWGFDFIINSKITAFYIEDTL